MLHDDAALHRIGPQYAPPIIDSPQQRVFQLLAVGFDARLQLHVQRLEDQKFEIAARRVDVKELRVLGACTP